VLLVQVLLAPLAQLVQQDLKEQLVKVQLVLLVLKDQLV
jgi:hypothetical protein